VKDFCSKEEDETESAREQGRKSLGNVRVVGGRPQARPPEMTNKGRDKRQKVHGGGDERKFKDSRTTKIERQKG